MPAEPYVHIELMPAGQNYLKDRAKAYTEPIGPERARKQKRTTYPIEQVKTQNSHADRAYDGTELGIASELTDQTEPPHQMSFRYGNRTMPRIELFVWNRTVAAIELR